MTSEPTVLPQDEKLKLAREIAELVCFRVWKSMGSGDQTVVDAIMHLREGGLDQGLAVQTALAAIEATEKLAREAEPAVGDDALFLVQQVHDNFAAALAQGYQTADKTYAVAMLSKAIAAMQPQAPATGDVAELVERLERSAFNWAATPGPYPQALYREAAAKLTELQAQVDRLRARP